MSLTVTGVKATAELDGSHAIEMSDGSIAIIPRDHVPRVAMTLQVNVAKRVFAQSQRLDVPTESILALTEFHLEDARPAAIGAATNLACSLSECGWVVFLCEDDVLRALKVAIDEVLVQRASSSRAN